MTDDIDVREAIIELRGGVPAKCDFCGNECHPDNLHPEEAGEWICNGCIEAIIRREGKYP